MLYIGNENANIIFQITCTLILDIILLLIFRNWKNLSYGRKESGLLLAVQRVLNNVKIWLNN